MAVRVQVSIHLALRRRRFAKVNAMTVPADA
jgi:hypothetical protein